MIQKSITFWAILFVPLILSAQENEKAKISGIVFNQETQKPLGYVQLVSYETMLSYASASDGTFLLSLPKSDSIKIVSMGFEGVVKKVSQFLETPGPDTIYLEPATYLLNEVTVNAKESVINLNLPGNIGKNVDPAQEPRASIPDPSLGMIFSPLSLAQSTFSKKARNQRKMRKVIQKRQEKSLWHQVLSSGLIKDWIEIDDKDMDDFIVFCNSKITVTNNDNLITLRGKVLHLWKQYKNKKD
jgi:hypothetical protein